MKTTEGKTRFFHFDGTELHPSEQIYDYIICKCGKQTTDARHWTSHQGTREHIGCPDCENEFFEYIYG